MHAHAKDFAAVNHVFELFIAKEREVEGREALDISATRCLVFTLIAEKPGITAVEIEKRLGQPGAVVSRQVQALSKYGKLGKPGMDLIESRIDPIDARKKQLFLTVAGQAFAERLVCVLTNRGDVRLEGVMAPGTDVRGQGQLARA